MKQESIEYYKQHSKSYLKRCENLKSVEASAEHVKLSLKSAISRKKKNEYQNFTRMLALLIAVWAESRLTKLLEEWEAFDEDFLSTIHDSGNSHFNKWEKVIQYSFSKHYNIELSEVPSSLSEVKKEQYILLMKVLEEDLKPLIVVRNKLAHGQWIYVYNKKNTSVNEDLTESLSAENFLSLNYKQSLIKSFANIIHDLVISKPTFERDFEKNYNNILSIKGRLNKSGSFEKFSERLQKRFDNRKPLKLND